MMGGFVQEDSETGSQASSEKVSSSMNSSNLRARANKEKAESIKSGGK